MGFFSGMGRGFRGILDGAAGTQALLAGDYGAFGRMRAQQARLRRMQADESRRPGLVDNLMKQGFDPAQIELALSNPEFARKFLPSLTRTNSRGVDDGNEDRSPPLVAHEETHGILPEAFQDGGSLSREDVLQDPRPGHAVHEPAAFAGQALGGDVVEEAPG